MVTAPDVRGMVLVHYPREKDPRTGKRHPFEFDPKRAYDPKRRSDKPDGLWVSVLGDDDWYSWCHAEGFAVSTLDNPHSVALTADANILVLDTADAIREFSSKYDAPPANLPNLGWRWYIDWPRLYREYDGIIIAPYQWEVAHGGFRSDHALAEGWYYGWDCASGAIWNLSAVVGVTALDKEPTR